VQLPLLSLHSVTRTPAWLEEKVVVVVVLVVVGEEEEEEKEEEELETCSSVCLVRSLSLSLYDMT